jgi:hypothetical protein
MKRLTVTGLLSIALVFGLFGCSKKPTGSAAATPADAEIVGTLDGKSLLSFVKQTLPGLLPAEMKDKLPAVETLIQGALNASEIDLGKISNLRFIGYAGSGDKMAIIAENVSCSDFKGLNGKQTGDHNGVPIFSLSEKMFYADVKGAGMVLAPSEEMVKKILDTSTGKEKCLAGTDRGKLLDRLTKLESDLDMARIYLLTENFPGEKPPFVFKGGAFVFHPDKGGSLLLLSDEAGAAQAKSLLDIGIMGAQTSLAFGTNQDMKMDEEAKKMISQIIKGISSKQDKDLLSVAYRGDLKPVIAKSIAMFAKEKDQAAPEPAPQE